MERTLLDKAPDDQLTMEMIFTDKIRTEDWLAGVYSSIPSPMWDCPVCKTNMSECTGTAPATPEPDKDSETDAPAPKPEKKSNIGMILVIFAVSYTHLP